MGFVEQLRGVEFRAPHRASAATITLIARRSVRRVGTRQWRRGADLEVRRALCTLCALGVVGGRPKPWAGAALPGAPC